MNSVFKGNKEEIRELIFCVTFAIPNWWLMDIIDIRVCLYILKFSNNLTTQNQGKQTLKAAFLIIIPEFWLMNVDHTGPC